MLLPKRVKYRRVQRGRLTGKALRGNTISNGEYGLQALEPAWITSNQFEMGGVDESIAREAMRLAMHKLPIKCKFVKKETEGSEE